MRLGEAPPSYFVMLKSFCVTKVSRLRRMKGPRHEVLLSRSFGKYHYFNWTYLIVSAAHVSQVSRSQQPLRRTTIPRLPPHPRWHQKPSNRFRVFQHDLLDLRIFSSTFVSELDLLRTLLHVASIGTCRYATCSQHNSMTYDWDDLKPQIIDLYIRRNLTLDEVARTINIKNGLDIR
jgi:Clr5 domain